MRLNSKRVNFEYQPGEEIFTFPEDTGLPFIFDVLDEELTENIEAMDVVGQMPVFPYLQLCQSCVIYSLMATVKSLEADYL